VRRSLGARHEAPGGRGRPGRLSFAPSCTSGRPRGGPGNDRLAVVGGVRSELRGGPGPDRILGGPGYDNVYGGPGGDILGTRDGRVEIPYCGNGVDRLLTDRLDQPAADCELIILPRAAP